MPTVTIFGNSDDLTAAVADEVVALGSSAHLVLVPTGWITSGNRAVIMLDTVAGRSAVEALCELDDLVVEIVGLSAAPPEGDVARWCDGCDLRHHLTLLAIDPADTAQAAEVAASVLRAA